MLPTGYRHLLGFDSLWIQEHMLSPKRVQDIFGYGTVLPSVRGIPSTRHLEGKVKVLETLTKIIPSG